MFACECFNQYVYGREVNVESDHKPLEAIMVKPLCQTPPRIQRLLIRLQKYRVTVNYVPGKYMFIVDTLSRAHLTNDGGQLDLHDDIEVIVHRLVASIPATPEKINELKRSTQQDETLQTLKATLQQGWPEHRQSVPACIAPYWNIRHDLSEAKGLLFKDNKLIIPSSMRKDTLKLIHESHQGIEKCKSRARSVIHWPGMNNDIVDIVLNCTICATFRNQDQKEPMIPHEIPELRGKK